MTLRAASSTPDDSTMQLLISRVLRGGVVLAAAFVLTGGLVYLARHGGERPTYGAFRGEPTRYRCVTQIVAGALHLRGREIIQLGLLVLVGTPVMRVALAAVAFALQKDRLYTTVTLLVLCLLLYSLFFSS